MSAVKFNCPHCQQQNEAPYEYIGRTVACRHCAAESTVPPADPKPVLVTPESQRIFNSAESMDRSANGIGILMSILVALSVAIGSVACGVIAGSLLTIYLANKILAQLLHIRALLHRKTFED